MTWRATSAGPYLPSLLLAVQLAGDLRPNLVGIPHLIALPHLLRMCQYIVFRCIG